MGAIGLVITGTHDRADLGYWIGTSYWNNGYATEAGRAMLDYAFRIRGLNKVTAHYFAKNPASGRVLEKIGLRNEGVFRQHVKKWGEFLDCVMYGVLRSEWEASQPG
jgi:RimJ/RimL family protein N-acetyltransferase